MHPHTRNCTGRVAERDAPHARQTPRRDSLLTQECGAPQFANRRLSLKRCRPSDGTRIERCTHRHQGQRGATRDPAATAHPKGPDHGNPKQGKADKEEKLPAAVGSGVIRSPDKTNAQDANELK